MLTTIYKIQFDKSSYELNDDYENLSDYEKEIVSDLESEGFFDYDRNDKYICYVITTPMEIKSYIGILENNLINILCDDISQLVLHRKINLEDELEEEINTSNSIKYSFFVDDLDFWIYNNLEMDIVLDRITDDGIESLSFIERQFLEDFNNNK